MAVTGARNRVATVAAALCLYLQCFQCASFDCILSMESSTGTVQGAEVDLECTWMSGTSQPVEKPLVLYDASLTLKRMIGDDFAACCSIRKGRTPIFALQACVIVMRASDIVMFCAYPDACTCAHLYVCCSNDTHA